MCNPQEDKKKKSEKYATMAWQELSVKHNHDSLSSYTNGVSQWKHHKAMFKHHAVIVL